MSKHKLYENVVFLAGKEEKNLFYMFLSIVSVILDLFGISLVILLLL